MELWLQNKTRKNDRAEARGAVLEMVASKVVRRHRL